MTVKVTVARETKQGEKRVALVPSVMPKLTKLGLELHIPTEAGAGALIPDEAFAKAGVHVGATSLANTQVVFKIQPPTLAEIAEMNEGTVLYSFIYAHREPELVKALRDKKITCFAMELVPRTTRGQAMDALSSQAVLTGYFGSLLGATHLARMLPMTTTAVGSLRPAKVLVIGAGVAGLQAVATCAKRLGAIVEGYDVRKATKEQIESLGGKFVDTGVYADGAGGYARELTAEEKATQAGVLAKHIQAADIVISTAAIPGRPSPKIITAEVISGMKSGSVIIDLAAEGGGNTELTKPGETIRVGNTKIVAPLNVPSELAEHASELYSKNLLNCIELIVKNGELNLNWEDDIVSAMCLTHAGEIKNEAARKVVEG